MTTPACWRYWFPDHGSEKDAQECRYSTRIGPETTAHRIFAQDWHDASPDHWVDKRMMLVSPRGQRFEFRCNVEPVPEFIVTEVKR